MVATNTALVFAFPSVVREDAIAAAASFPETPQPIDAFSVFVAGERISIPGRIYHSPAEIDRHVTTPAQNELIDCLLTRHCDGFVRQESLSRIIPSPNMWIPPFVIQLVGEYVVETI
jgi:hypothetical protein